MRVACLTCLLITLLGVGRVVAQPCAGEVVTEVQFRWNSATLDTAYRSNAAALRELATRIEQIGIEQIDSVVVCSYASPEGVRRYNERLAARRATTMGHYIEQHHPALEGRLHLRADGESWRQLRARIAGDERLDKATTNRLLALLDDPATSIDTKKWRIEHDRAWPYLYRTHYPAIRHSMICLVYYHAIERNEPLALTLAEPIAPVRPTELEPLLPPVAESDTLTLALKTNLLYDLATALNVEVEMPIGEHFSVAVEYLFPWWERDNKYCFQLLELGVEGRYWFREQARHAGCLRGWFVGPYLMSGKYDLQYKRDLNYQGEFWSAGVTGGYALRLTRRLNLELSLSVGFLSTAYRHYFPADDYSELYRDDKSGRTSYFGPTKAKVALVWPLHFAYRKGGRR